MDPNALWAALPGAASPASVTITPPSWVRWAQPVEWVGRAAVVIIPVFCRFRLATVASMLAGEVMLLALAFYYTGWTRYFTGGRTPVLLYEPLFRVLLPPWSWGRCRSRPRTSCSARRTLPSQVRVRAPPAAVTFDLTPATRRDHRGRHRGLTRRRARDSGPPRQEPHEQPGRIMHVWCCRRFLGLPSRIVTGDCVSRRDERLHRGVIVLRPRFNLQRTP
jgi:hypothetical protein